MPRDYLHVNLSQREADVNDFARQPPIAGGHTPHALTRPSSGSSTQINVVEPGIQQNRILLRGPLGTAAIEDVLAVDDEDGLAPS